MNTQNIITSLKTLLNHRKFSNNFISIPFLGMISAVMAHRLHSVALQQSAAIIILSGRKTVFMGEETKTLTAGDIFLYPAMLEVTVENFPDPQTGRYMALCLAYNESTIAKVVSEQLDSISPTHVPLETLCARCTPSAETSLQHLLNMAIAHPRHEKLLSLCLEEFLLLISEQTNCLPLLWRAMTTWKARCASLIGMEPNRRWTSQGIAEKLNVSERTLRRHLQEEGTNLRDILQEVRINSGLALLQTGTVSVGEAASRCGYNSTSHFSGRFKDRFGVSPSEILRFEAGSGQSLAESL